MKERLLSVKQAADILGLKPKTLYQWKWLKVNIPFIKVGRALRVSERDLYEFIKRNKVS